MNNYNERLFKGNSLRSKLHFARYIWLEKKIKEYGCSTNKVLELGCFDGKTLEFLDTLPKKYEGFDANWEGGLDLGKKKWGNKPEIQFNLCEKVEQFNPSKNQFDISICQETIEHLPIKQTEEYIKKMAEASNEYAFISVPNEKGIIFLLKHFYKRIVQSKEFREKYTWKEILYATFGRLNKVERFEGGHKGFDYKDLEQMLKKYFDVIEVNGLPGKFPAYLGFTVGFVCKKR